ncbi:MAG TPA: SDR family oxidoreductase [Methylomirabilota bacterium]|nr:SDR family oxidoreductase [Methylomirabilota bacterium]
MSEADRMCLKGCVTLVTGASRGLGRALALALGAAGAAVACAARSADDLEATVTGIREAGGVARPFRLDVTHSDEVVEVVAAIERALGPIDVLVNNAGRIMEKKTEEMTDGEWETMLATNLSSMFWCARAVAPSMMARGRGKIINVGSIWGRMGVARHTAYCVTKAGVEALTRCLAVEWARHGIQVNCLAPGYMATDFNEEQLDDEKIRRRILSRIPLRRVGQPDELGPLAVYLASPASSFMTGHTLCFDGGQVIAG